MSRNAIRETLGFIGVIASLIFVGLEIHQNTLASRACVVARWAKNRLVLKSRWQLGQA